MRLPTTYCLLLVTVAVLGCNNFNRVIAVQAPLGDELKKRHFQQRPRPLKTDTESTLTAEELCPLYRPLLLPKTPDLPYKELSAISPHDGEAMDRIQRQHIEDLRLYITRLKAVVAKNHLDYLTTCKAHLTKNK